MILFVRLAADLHRQIVSHVTRKQELLTGLYVAVEVVSKIWVGVVYQSAQVRGVNFVQLTQPYVCSVNPVFI